MNEAQIKEARILMLDDDVSNTSLLSNFLNRLGYSNLRTLNDSTAVFSEVEAFQPDLILLDLMMPGIDGFGILGHLRKNEEAENQIPILVLTGSTSPQTKRRAFACGATDLLAKPFDASEISVRIRNLLQSRFLRLEIQEQNRLLEQRVRERTNQLETAMKKLQGAQATMLQQERLSAFGEMAGGVVHDFSNTLMAIIGYSSLLLSDGDARTDEATLLEYLAIINTAGKDGANIVGRLRDFYRPRDAGDSFEALDLNEIATQSVALARLRCSQRPSGHAITFQTDFAPRANAAGNGSELREVLTNLIFNAVDATPRQGVITIRTLERNDEVVLEVRDTGTGMTPEVKQRCLEPFFTTKGEQGTGLGLAMVFGIIQRHQGRMEIDSEPGRGSTFRICLAAAVGSAVEEAVSLVENNLRLEIGHVLFIDIVGYSKLLIEEQKERLHKLTEIVLASPQVSKSTNEQLVRLPTGDGMALVFRNSSEEPARCALEIAQALKAHPEIAVRIGVHSGPVSEVTDVNERTNIAGAGINMAQRVMDCGDAGHILLSKRVAEDLESYRHWAPHLHSLGECEVKHGVRIQLVNFYTDEVGNTQLPEKFRQLAEKKAASVVSRRDEELRVAVLPFKSTGDAETESFAEGLADDLTTGLSRFGYLSVVASASDARYVLKGSIRKGGSGIRVMAQLVDTRTGTQLWAETYNRDLQALTIFDAQEDIAARIVATVTDSYGVLVHSMREASRQKDDADFSPAEWQFQYFAYREQITPAGHGALRSRLEATAKSDNQPSDLWASLAQVYVDEYAFGFPGNDGKSLDRALSAARRGVELDRANQFAMVALAQTHFFRQDLAAFGPAAERAMALNPLNTDALGILGLEIVHTGEFERGTAIVRRAMELNPNHAGWMHFAPLWDHFHKGEYEEALECANRVDVPGLFWPFLVMASACGHLGRRAEAAAAVQDLLALDPEFAAHARSNVGTWHFASDLMDPILEGLRKAGLGIPENDESSDRAGRSVCAAG